MKIVYLIAGTYRPAGMEKVLAGKVNWLAARGHEVLIATTDQMGRPAAFEMDPSVRTVDLGINYEENNGGSFLDKALHFPGKQRRHRKALTALLLAERPDITVSMFCNDAGFVPKIKDGSRKILEIHFSRFKRLQYGRKGLFGLADRILTSRDKRTASRFDRFVVLTKEDAGYWGRMKNIKVISNARPFKFDKPAALEEKCVLAVGRYNHQKGFDMLIEAWSRIPKDLLNEGWKLRLVGEGELREALQAQIGSLGLEDSVMLGRAEKDMKEVYAHASVLALSSRYEGLPMVLLEAQAAGIPIVSFDCKCGPKDVISQGKDGWLVPTGNTKMLAARLERLMRDPELRKLAGEAAYSASDRYDEERIMQRWIRLFKDVLGNRSEKRTLVVSAVNLRKGGTLSILRSCLEYLSGRSEEFRIIALVHKKDLCNYPGIDYIEMPWCVKSWFHRLWAEYVTMYGISKRIAKEDGRTVWTWLSLHDTTPRVQAERREVYCHTSFPFMKIKAHDFLMDPKIPLFAMFTRLAYAVNIHRNDCIIVQQQWFADAMSKMLHVKRERFRVIPPEHPEIEPLKAKPAKPYTFFFASTPDCHKNFETLCMAAEALEQRVGKRKFKVIITVKGNENRYAGWLYKNWGHVESISFKGFLSQKDLYQTYASAQCLVFPSRIETWGLPISEYAAVHPEGGLLLADLPYAHETAADCINAKYFPATDFNNLQNLMYENLTDR